MSTNLSGSLMILLTLMAAGCGQDDNGLRGASGQVLLDGSPLVDGTVGLVDPSGKPAGVGIIKGGKFDIKQSASYDGVQPGTYQVTVESWDEQPGVELEDGSFSEGKLLTPEKYRNYQTSGLTIEVPENGTDEIVLDLSSDS